MGRHVEIINVPGSFADTPEKALDVALEMHEKEYGTSQHPDIAGSFTVAPQFQNESIDRDGLLSDTDDTAVIVPIISDENTIVRTVKKSLTFTGEEWGNNPDSNLLILEKRYNMIMNSLKQQVHLRTGEEVTSFLVDGDWGNSSSILALDELNEAMWANRESKIVSRATEGKTVTRYALVFPDNLHTRLQKSHETFWKEGYASQAEARKAMNTIMDENQRIDSAEIVSVTRREDGSPLVVSKREVSNVTINVKARLANLSTAPTTWEYWVAFLVKT